MLTLFTFILSRSNTRCFARDSGKSDVAVWGGVFERENMLTALKRVESGRDRWDGSERLVGLPESALAGSAGGSRKWEVSAKPREASRNTEARRRGEAVGHTHSARPARPASHSAGVDADVRASVLSAQLWVSTRTECAPGREAIPGVHPRRLRLGGGYRLGKVLRPGQPRHADGAQIIFI